MTDTVGSGRISAKHPCPSVAIPNLHKNTLYTHTHIDMSEMNLWGKMVRYSNVLGWKLERTKKRREVELQIKAFCCDDIKCRFLGPCLRDSDSGGLR